MPDEEIKEEASQEEASPVTQEADAAAVEEAPAEESKPEVEASTE